MTTTPEVLDGVASERLPDLMRAAVLDTDGRLVVESIPVPQPGQGEVLVKVAACGVCHSDLSVIKGSIPFPKPMVIGHEIAGTVVKHGSGVPAEVPAVGAPVACGFVMPCGGCPECARGRDDLCRRFFGVNRTHGTLYDGTSRLSRRDGSELKMFSMSGMAEYAVVPATDVFALPAGLPVVEASVLGCAVFTAYGAIKHAAQLGPSHRVAVVAVGGVGSSIVRLARAFGVRTVVAVDVSDDKLAAASAAGATAVVNATDEDPVAGVLAATDGDGVDVAFEALGRPDTFRQAVDMVRPGGRVVPVGLSPAEVSVPITKFVRSQVRIVGSYGGRTRQDMPELLAMASDGVVDVESLVTRTFGIEEVAEAYAALERGEIVGRAVVSFA